MTLYSWLNTPYEDETQINVFLSTSIFDKPIFVYVTLLLYSNVVILVPSDR